MNKQLLLNAARWFNAAALNAYNECKCATTREMADEMYKVAWGWWNMEEIIERALGNIRTKW